MEQPGCPTRAVNGVRKGKSSRLPLKGKQVKVSTGAFEREKESVRGAHALDSVSLNGH
jgi:hypothetical protein